MTKLFFGRTASYHLSIRHPLVDLLCADGGDLVNVRNPMPYISLPERLLVGRRRGVDRALVRGLDECVYGLNFLGGFTSPWYLDVNGAASSGWSTTYQRNLHSLHGRFCVAHVALKKGSSRTRHS